MPLPPKPKSSREWRDTYYHKLLGLKAAKRVESILPLFEKERPNDERPRKAIEAIQEWAEGTRKLDMSEVRKLSLGSHAAAKLCTTEIAKCVAHAAGQAIGTWHAPAHALGAFEYAGRASAMRRRGTAR
jgi:hypothetical protein